MLPDVLGELLVVKFGLVKKKPLLVGVSGGPDSLCLLDALHKAGFLITVAHFDHMLRPTSSQDAQKVAAEAGQRGLAFIVGQEDISLFSSQMKLSIEEAARVARYHFLFEKAAAIQAQAVVVGHNADDQVETILMHFIRGAGLDGLGGMHSYSLPNPWSKEIPLVRPLLGVWRSEIEEYCRTEKLTPIEDETNNQTKYFRNKLRHELIPELAAYNPQIKQRLVNMGEVLRQDAVLIAETLAIAWKECVKTEDPKWIIFNRTMVNTKNLAVRRMLLRQVMNQLAPDLRDLDYQVVERGIQFIQEPG
ncbi:MAG TPA: tRNA lysidine(34) synthetase TilS, partial [Longilinea sp.]|nr:tRNA lysidine(34) synthetase TilS [Longilinea sp.]